MENETQDEQEFLNSITSLVKALEIKIHRETPPENPPKPNPIAAWAERNQILVSVFISIAGILGLQAIIETSFKSKLDSIKLEETRAIELVREARSQPFQEAFQRIMTLPYHYSYDEDKKSSYISPKSFEALLKIYQNFNLPTKASSENLEILIKNDLVFVVVNFDYYAMLHREGIVNDDILQAGLCEEVILIQRILDPAKNQIPKHLTQGIPRSSLNRLIKSCNHNP